MAMKMIQVISVGIGMVVLLRVGGWARARRLDT